MQGNAHASTSASAVEQPPTAAATAFGSQDFIAFDFNDDDDAAAASTSTDLQQQQQQPSQPTTRKERNAKGRASDVVASSSQAAGKKRKIDDRRDDGKTKQERIQERKELRSKYTPWSADVDWDRCRNGAEMLHRELMAFDMWLAPTYAEHETRVMVIDLIRRAIKGRWSDAEVYSFGSQETKLYLPQGDIDLVVVSDMMDYQARETVLRAMASTLRQHNLATQVQVIARAKVPIVKFVCTYAKLHVDISVNQTNGLSAAKYVNSWLRKTPSMRPLVMAVKHLLVQRGMSEVFSGGLGSYSVILMVISFLQLHPKLQRAEIDPARNLGVLFLEFLELYGKNFGYDTCGISIRGKGGYFSKARRGWRDERKPFMLCIEDPHDPSNDISRGSYGILNIRAVFSGAFDIVTAAICHRGRGAAERATAKQPTHRKFGDGDDDDDDDSENEDAAARRVLLEEARGVVHNPDDKDPKSLLGCIVGVSKAMMKQRSDMEDLYHSGSLQNRLGRPPPLPSPPPAERYMRADASASASASAPKGPKGKAAQQQQQQQQGPSPKKIKGQAQRLAASAASSQRRGNASDPISISSSPDRDLEPSTTLSIRGAANKQHQNGRANGSAAATADGASRSSSPDIVDEAELAASQGFSFSSGSNPSQSRGEALMGLPHDSPSQSAVHAHSNGVIEILSTSDEEDSRYNAAPAKRRKTAHNSSPHVAAGKGRNGARGARRGDPAAEMEDLSMTAPSTFVDDSSDDAASAAGGGVAGAGRGAADEEDAVVHTTDAAGAAAAAATAQADGPRRSRRLSAVRSASASASAPASPAKRASSLGAIREGAPASDPAPGGAAAPPAARSPKKLTARARREYWASKGVVSPKEQEGDLD